MTFFPATENIRKPEGRAKVYFDCNSLNHRMTNEIGHCREPNFFDLNPVIKRFSGRLGTGHDLEDLRSQDF